MLSDNFSIIGKLLDEYGDLVRVWIGSSLIAINKKPKDIEVKYNSTVMPECLYEMQFYKVKFFYVVLRKLPSSFTYTHNAMGHNFTLIHDSQHARYMNLRA